jgi:integral membrane sensor domain MASE1
LPRFGHLAAIFLIAALAAWAGIGLTRATHGVAALWLTNGIMIAMLLARPPRQWPALLAAGLGGDVVVGHLVGDHFGQTMVMEGSNGLEILVAAALLYCRRGRLPDLTLPGALVDFAVIGVVVAPMCSGLPAAGLLAPMWGVSFPHLLTRWCLGDALGIAVMTPLALSVLRGDLRSLLAPPALLGTLGVVAAFVLLAVPVFTTSRVPLLFVLFPPLLLGVMRLGFAGAGLLMLPTAAIALTATVGGLGPLTLVPGITPEQRLAFIQVYLAVLCGTAYLVGVGVAERRRLTRALVDEHVRLAGSERLYRLLADNSSDIIVRASTVGGLERGGETNKTHFANASIDLNQGWNAALSCVRVMKKLQTVIGERGT